MDIDVGWTAECIQAVSVLSRLLRGFLRWQTFRHEGRLGAHRCLHGAPIVPKLVSTALSVRLCHVPLCGGIEMATAPRMATSTVASQALAEFSSDVIVGLGQPGQKELPSKYLYDEVGSALFDVICLLPEYGLSRAGMRSLKRYAPDIINCLNGPFVVAELGSGSGQKTRFLLEALSRRQRVNYYPIDISGSALHRCRQELGEMDRVSIVGFERAYIDGLREVAARRR